MRRREGWSAMLAVAMILIAAGYWGPWVAHKAAALIIPGLDLAEYVKFLPEYRSRQVHILREGFYLPLLTLSLALSLLSWQRAVGWPRALRVIAWLASLSAALAMLPPAWSPAVLRQPEFRLQVIAIVICLAAVAAAPLWHQIRMMWLSWVLTLLALAAIVVPIGQFWVIQPALDRVYGRPIATGWGPGVMVLGLVLLIIAVMAHRRR